MNKLNETTPEATLVQFGKGGYLVQAMVSYTDYDSKANIGYQTGYEITDMEVYTTGEEIQLTEEHDITREDVIREYELQIESMATTEYDPEENDDESWDDWN